MQEVIRQTTSKSSGLNRSEKKLKIGRITIGLSAIAVLSKFLGFGEKILIAHFFGTEAQADIYFLVMGVVFAAFFFCKELIYPSILPVFASSLKKSLEVSSSFFKKIVLTFSGLLVLFVLALILFSKTIISFLAPGFSDDNLLTAASLLRYLAPACFFLCLSTVTYAVLNSHKKFLAAALADAIFKLVIIIGLILFVPRFGLNALGITVTFSAMLVLFTQLLFIPETKKFLSYDPYCPNQEIKQTFSLMVPLMIGVVFSHISTLVDNALASTLPTGHLSYLGYSKRLIDAILLIGPVALVTVVFAQLSNLNADGKMNELRKLFMKSLRLILFVSVPLTGLLILLREPIVSALFESGRFTAHSTLGTSQMLFIYSTGLVTFSVEALVVYSFYALSNTKVPIRAGILGVGIDIVLAIAFLEPLGAAAIAWALVISKTIKVIILVIILGKKLHFYSGSGMVKFSIKLITASLVATCLVYMIVNFESGNSFFSILVFDLAIPSMGFILIFILSCLLLRLEELRFLVLIFIKRNTAVQLRIKNG